MQLIRTGDKAAKHKPKTHTRRLADNDNDSGGVGRAREGAEERAAVLRREIAHASTTGESAAFRRPNRTFSLPEYTLSLCPTSSGRHAFIYQTGTFHCIRTRIHSILINSQSHSRHIHVEAVSSSSRLVELHQKLSPWPVTGGSPENISFNFKRSRVGMLQLIHCASDRDI